MSKVSRDFINYLNDNIEVFQLKGKRGRYSKEVAAVILCVLKNSNFFENETKKDVCLTHREIYSIIMKYDDPDNQLTKLHKISNDREVYRILYQFDFFEPNKRKVYNPYYKKEIKTNDWRVNEEKLKKFIGYDGDIREKKINKYITEEINYEAEYRQVAW